VKFAEPVQQAAGNIEIHVPVITAPDSVRIGEKFAAQVAVGKEIAHPNTTEHHIRWIRLFFTPDSGEFAYDVAAFDLGSHGESAEGTNKGPILSEPGVQVELKLSRSGTLVAIAYCNIHGVWESAKSIKVEV